MKQFHTIVLIAFGILLLKTNERACAFRAGTHTQKIFFKKVLTFTNNSVILSM